MSDKTKPFLCLCEVRGRYILQEQGFGRDMALSADVFLFVLKLIKFAGFIQNGGTKVNFR